MRQRKEKDSSEESKNLELAELYLEQLSERKSDVIQKIRTVLNRAYIFMGIIIPLSTGTIALLISTNENSLWLALLFQLCVLGILLLILGNKQKNHGKGSSLEELRVKDFIEHCTAFKDKEKMRITEECLIKVVGDLSLKYAEEIRLNEKQLEELLKWQVLYMRISFVGIVVVSLLQFLDFFCKRCN